MSAEASSRWRGLIVWARGAGAFLLFTHGTWAQVLPPPPDFPGLPAIPEAAARLYVEHYRFEGNTAVSDRELEAATAPFAGREVGADELEEARRAVTLLYVNRGFVNSGAVLPDQDPTNGVVTMRIVEGRLTEVRLTGNRWLTDRYITSRLQRWTEPPLNLRDVQEGLQILRQNPNVKQVNAELRPGLEPGESQLDLRVVDQHPFRVGLEVNNHRPPSVGAEQISLLLADLNLTGHNDRLDFRYGIAFWGKDGPEFSGADNLEGSYAIPLTRFDTTFGFRGSRLNTGLFEEPFIDLDIESLTGSGGVFLRQPIYQRANQELAVGLAFDHRWNRTWLLGERFSLSPGAVDGEMVVSVLRFSQEWVQRGQNHVLALRSTFNFGLDVWDATDDGVPGNPDGTFFSWLGQGQYVQRLFGTQNQLLLRLTGQWANDPLLALEQISVGGAETVRGYRENQLVRDRGLISSIEFRIPVLFNKAGAGIIHLAPFFDFGGGWNEGVSEDIETITSAGIGLLLDPSRHLSAQLYWGHPFRDVGNPSNEDPQDLGLHFQIVVNAF